MELDWTETFFRMLDLIVGLIESTLDWTGGKSDWILEFTKHPPDSLNQVRKANTEGKKVKNAA